MKALRKFSILLILAISLIFKAYATDKQVNTLILDKENKVLSAPGAVSYQWYFNGKRLQQTGQNIRIMSAGSYEVKMTDSGGKTSSASMSVGLNAGGEVYVIYLIGDSTVTDYNAGYYPQKGWGQVLHYFFDSSIIIENKAIGGQAARSFYNDLWAPIRDALNPGDFVFIGFGINDRNKDDPDRYSDATAFKEFLADFATETQARGAFPVIVTTVRRDSWNADGTVYDAWHEHPVVSRDLAGELNLPLIDLDQMSLPLYEGLGPDYVGPFMYLILDTLEYPNYPVGREDHVHFQEMGAIEMARLVVEAIQDYPNDTVMNRLIPHLKPMYEISTSTNFPDGAIITRTASYPEGTPVTIKAKVDPAFDLLEWQDGDGDAVSTGNRYQFTMGSDSISLTAILDDDPVADCLGEWNGTAYLDDCNECIGGSTGFGPCYPYLPDDTFRIESVQSGLCLEETSPEGKDNIYVTQEACRNDYLQAWVFSREGNNYTIKNAASGRYMSVGSVSLISKLTTDPGPMLWRLESTDTDTLQFVVAENYEYIMEITGTSVSEGTRTWLQRRNDEPNEKFLLSEFRGQELGLDKTTFDNIIAVSPNPFRGETLMRFRHQDGSFYSVSCFDICGKEVMRIEKESDGEMKFGSGLAPGIYIVKVSNGQNTETLKLIKK